MTIPKDATKDILLLCVKRPEADETTLTAALREAVALCHGIETELATITPPTALPALAHVAAPDKELPDAILTLRASGEALFARLPDVAMALESVVDRARSSLLAADRHTILPGRNAIRLFFGLRRLETLTLEAFQDYWLNRHAELGRRLIPPYSYHQLHTDPVATLAAAPRAGISASTFDGVVEVHFPDIGAFVAQLSRPEVAEEALADERRFIDHARSIFWAYHTLPG